MREDERSSRAVRASYDQYSSSLHSATLVLGSNLIDMIVIDVMLMRVYMF